MSCDDRNQRCGKDIRHAFCRVGSNCRWSAASRFDVGRANAWCCPALGAGKSSILENDLWNYRCDGGRRIGIVIRVQIDSPTPNRGKS